MPVSVRRVRLFPVSIGQACLWAFLPSLALLLIASPAVSLAQVVTNITPTTIAPLDLGTNVDTVGATTEITGGTRPGNGTNLFHSFDAFTLGTGDTAHFLNDMQLPTTNIFGRVIGGEVSTIDGTLRTNNPLNAADPMNFGAANLWLVNPSGLFLGPNARIEVGGSVSLSTANYLRFEGTSTFFDMLSSPASLGPLSVAPVAAFGFLGPEPPAPITVQGSMLPVPEGQSLSLMGGDITLQAEPFEDGTMQAASLRAPGGQLNLVSVASPGEMLVPSLQTGPNINGTSFTTMGTVTLMEGTTLDVSGQIDEFGSPIGNGNSGTVFVRGGQLVMDTSAILASTVGAVDGASTAVDVQVSHDVALSNGAAIITTTSGPGRGGDVHMTADSLTLENGSRIITETFFGEGVGGDLILNVGTLHLLGGLFGGSLIVSSNSNFNDGTDLGSAGGNVTVQANSVVLSGPNTGIVSDSTFGVPGDLTVNAETLTITNGAVIGAGSSQSTAPAGAVTITADSVVIAAGGQIFSHTFAQDAGPVTITTNALTLDKGSIMTNTSGLGRGGDVVLDIGSISLSNGATLNSSSSGTEADAGDAGDVTITTSGAFTSNASTIATSAENARGGNIDVTTQSVALSNGTVVSASSRSPLLPDGEGNAGNITVRSGSTFVMNNSTVTTEASQASGGQITITAPEMVWLINSQVSTSVAGDFVDTAAGNITIDPQFVILQNSQIFSQSNAGAGGAVLVTAGFFLMDPASVLAASSQLGVLIEFESPLSKVTAHLSQQFSSAAALLLAQRCAADSTGQFSSFVQTGRDGVPQVPGALSPSPLSFLETLTSGSLGSQSPNWAAARLGLDSVRGDDTPRFYSACRS